MLPGFSQSPDWLSSEPFAFDDVQSLMDYLPTPPQSPPPKKPLSREEQLSYVSDLLLEDQDLQLLGWSCDLFEAAGRDDGGDSRLPCSPLDEAAEDSLWQCLAERGLEEKLAASVLGSSPLLSDIDTSIFEDMVGSTLDCQNLMGGAQQQSEATSDYGSAGGETSTSSDSEEEIDVVSVGSSSPSPLPSPAEPSARRLNQEEEQRAIQLQHNYAAPCPASPPPPPASSGSSHKRSRGGDGPSRFHHATRSFAAAAASSSSRYHHSSSSSRSSTETEDEEERRRTHNVMERQRRNELKNCFVRLRDNVPELSHNDKASKVVILKKARDCIHGLEGESLRLRARKDRLRAKQEELKARLEQLRR